MMTVLTSQKVPEKAPKQVPNQVLRKADGFVSRTIAGDVIIVPVRGGVGDLDAIFTLNSVGATIWNLIDGATPIERLAAAVCREYEVGEDAAKDDVATFVQLLMGKGLLAATEDSAAARAEASAVGGARP
jgi:coenzyme PQQ synthesis protein D (PqqD)